MNGDRGWGLVFEVLLRAKRAPGRCEGEESEKGEGRKTHFGNFFMLSARLLFESYDD